MNLATIEMERPKAIEAFKTYRAAVRARHFIEDEQLLRGYRELARGRRLISLTQAFETAGLMDVEVRDFKGLVTISKAPKLAICEADAKRCILTRNDGRPRFHSDRERDLKQPAKLVGEGYVRGPADLLPRNWAPVMETVVPLAPVALRPARGLGGYHVLWEVERWSVKPVPPGDPALLKYIGGDLWAVIAIWDLTELEKLVLMGR